MPSKNSRSYIKTATADKYKQQQPELLQKDFRNVEYSNNNIIENNNIEELKRKMPFLNQQQQNKDTTTIMEVVLITHTQPTRKNMNVEQVH